MEQIELTDGEYCTVLNALACYKDEAQRIASLDGIAAQPRVQDDFRRSAAQCQALIDKLQGE
jgi:hypothetical protein